MIGIIGVVIMFTVQIVILVRFKKNTARYCEMRLLPKPVEVSDAVGNDTTEQQ